MAFIFRKEEKAKQEEQMIIVPLLERRPMWQTSFHFFTLVLILVFVNWGAPFALDKGLWTFLPGHQGDYQLPHRSRAARTGSAAHSENDD